MNTRLAFSSPRRFVFELAERFVPDGIADPDLRQRTRTAVLQAWLGIPLSLTFGTLYAACGSPRSGGALLLITLALVAVPSAIRRGASIVSVANVFIFATWVATAITSSRSGGFASAAIAWNFLFPLVSYAVCGRRSAVVWSILAAAQLLGFYLADVAGVTFAQDFSPRIFALLRLSGYGGIVLTTIVMLSMVEETRRTALEAIHAQRRVQERAQLLDDMHDGIGSQLLGLLMMIRAGAQDRTRLASSVESCLADLRLIVAWLDPVEQNLLAALGELRARLEPKVAAARIDLAWDVDSQVGEWVDSAGALHVLRALQEMLTNAIRHSGARQIEVRLSLDANARVADLCVRDDGVGLPSVTDGPQAGRGLPSLRARAARLGGEFLVERATPGTVARLRWPVRPAPSPSP